MDVFGLKLQRETVTWPPPSPGTPAAPLPVKKRRRLNT